MRDFIQISGFLVFDNFTYWRWMDKTYATIFIGYVRRKIINIEKSASSRWTWYENDVILKETFQSFSPFTELTYWEKKNYMNNIYIYRTEFGAWPTFWITLTIK